MKIGITAKITKEPIYPVDVWAGRDTKIRIEAKADNLRLPVVQVQWIQCLRVVARNNGNERLLLRSDDHKFGQIYRECGPATLGFRPWGATGFYVGDKGSVELGFALRDVPREWGEIWLELDLGIRPSKNRNYEQAEISKEILGRLKRQSGAVWAWESQSFLLRGKDEVIRQRLVSKDPQLVITHYHLTPRNYHFMRPKSNYRYLWLHVSDVVDKRRSKLNDFGNPKTIIPWYVVDEKGRRQKTSEKDLSGFRMDALCGISHKEDYFPTIDIRFAPNLAPKARQLRLRGALSCDNRWPLMVDIPLLDRTEKPTLRK